MKTPGLIAQHKRLIWLIAQAKVFDATQLEMQAHWGRYLCVLVSGFLENAIGEIYSAYAKKSSSPHVAQFVQTHVLKIQNPKSKKFVEVASQFKKSWGAELETFLLEDGRKEAIDSIISNRHLIAHGENSGITIAGVDKYLKKSVAVIEFIETQCGL